MEKAGGGGGKRLSRGQATSFGFKRPQPAQQEPKKPVNEVSAYGFRKPSPGEHTNFKKPSKSEPAPPCFRKSVPEHVSQPPVTVQETIQPLLIAPVRPKTPVQVNTTHKEKPANRFGFRGPPLSNKVADVDVPVNSPIHQTSQNQLEPRKYRLEWSNLPRAQCAVRVPVAAGYSAEADKRAKTAANTALSNVAPSEASRVPKPERYDSVLEIQQLEQSPSMVNKFRQTQQQLQLQHEQNLQQQQEKTKSRTVGTSGSSDNAQRPPTRPPSLHRPVAAPSVDHMAFSSNDETGDEGFDETSTEEKQTRDQFCEDFLSDEYNSDKEANEKDMLGCGESPTEEMWGRGEAMAIEEELCANFTAIDQSPATPPLRSVLLKIEDPTFASLAAISQSALLEDETLPDSPDLSCSSPSSVEPLPPPPVSLSAKDSPASPGTPTHGTNSLSGSDTRDRDFLIDDEIADQPGLVFDNRAGQRLVDASRTISKLADEVSEALASVNPKLSGSRQSVSTLSPCDSLTSDDLIADFDTSDLSNFDDLDDAGLKSELQLQSGQVMRDWNNLLSSHQGLKNTRRKMRLSGGSTSSGPRVDSPQSVSSPVRNKRLGMNSPGDDGSDDSGIRVDRGTYQHMFQVVVNVKPMLVRLQRILQEGMSTPADNGSDDSGIRVDRATYQHMFQFVINIKSMLVGLQRILQEGMNSPADDGSDDSGIHVDRGTYQHMFQDVINIKSMLVRLQRVLQEDNGCSGSCQEDEGEELADLRRQVVLLCAQVDERNRRIARLEEELCKRRTPVEQPAARTAVNKATQTDRIRPISTSQALFQSSPDNSTASFVSCMNEKKN